MPEITFPDLAGEKKQTLKGISESERFPVARYKFGHVDYGHNGPGNEIPLLIQSERHHRLDIQDILFFVIWSKVEVRIVLKGQADQITYGILGLPLQFGSLIIDRLTLHLRSMKSAKTSNN